jgi:septal ring factor EnvC (AmiA/AmiB activator)
MVPFSKFILRGAVVGAIGLGAAAVIAGPHRIGGLFTQARSAINDKIDANITDPVALRAQIRDLAAQYPRRIGEVRGDLAQLKEQQAQLNRDLAVSQRVVSMADGDLDKLSTALGHAQTALIQNAGFGVETSDTVQHKVVIVFKNEKLEVEQAQVKSNQIAATRNAYAQRAADIQRDLGYLGQQERQLTQLLTKLEAEQTSFQTQMFDLDRQIDAISRNDRMIEILKDRQDTLNEQSRYRAASLDQITSKLADIRARQEATLDSLARAAEHFSYEDAAKAQLDREKALEPVEASPPAGKAAGGPAVIEINPDRLPMLPKQEGPVAVTR